MTVSHAQTDLNGLFERFVRKYNTNESACYQRLRLHRDFFISPSSSASAIDQFLKFPTSSGRELTPSLGTNARFGAIARVGERETPYNDPPTGSQH
jgi:hypothetical protein